MLNGSSTSNCSILITQVIAKHPNARFPRYLIYRGLEQLKRPSRSSKVIENHVVR